MLSHLAVSFLPFSSLSSCLRLPMRHVWPLQPVASLSHSQLRGKWSGSSRPRDATELLRVQVSSGDLGLAAAGSFPPPIALLLSALLPPASQTPSAHKNPPVLGARYVQLRKNNAPRCQVASRGVLVPCLRGCGASREGQSRAGVALPPRCHRLRARLWRGAESPQCCSSAVLIQQLRAFGCLPLLRPIFLLPCRQELRSELWEADPAQSNGAQPPPPLFLLLCQATSFTAGSPSRRCACRSVSTLISPCWRRASA